MKMLNKISISDWD